MALLFASWEAWNGKVYAGAKRRSAIGGVFLNIGSPAISASSKDAV